MHRNLIQRLGDLAQRAVVIRCLSKTMRQCDDCYTGVPFLNSFERLPPVLRESALYKPEEVYEAIDSKTEYKVTQPVNDGWNECNLG